MRSYYAHLETAMGSQTRKQAAKPVFRASAIFPVFQQAGISSRILFLGYWILKRKIQQISAVVTLRSLKGEILNRETMAIVDPKTYRIELSAQLEQAGLPSDIEFAGSLEVEFFSGMNLVFPYPAVAINYYGPNFSSVVHTAQRVYNDFEDMRANSQTHVPESGFNIYVDDNREPFVGLINGPMPVPEAKIEMEFFNKKGKSISKELNLGTINPYQTELLFPAELINLKEFLEGDVGAGKLKFHVNWIFPRLVVGNMQQNPAAMTITHTYYDCTQAKSESDYWLSAQPGWHAAALILPLKIDGEWFTNLYFYPIYSPSSFSLDIELYNSSGTCLGRKKEVLKIDPSFNELKQINMKNVAKELGIKATGDLAVRVIARAPEGGRIPARIKVGFDIGVESQAHMPCNICTNLQPYVPALETKPSTFRWSPLLTDQPSATLWVLNSSPHDPVTKAANFKLNFYREKDTEFISREYTIEPNGFLVIRPDQDEVLSQFFGDQVGWCTVVASNPYANNYYFSQNRSGVIGGDHGF